MSFWSENKGVFKSAGIATAKGIGSGTKALSKAGYKTYKNHDGSNRVPQAPGREADQSPRPLVSRPVMEKDKLQSLPPPPRRNVPVNSVPTRASMTSKYSSQSVSSMGSRESDTGTQVPQLTAGSQQDLGSSQNIQNMHQYAHQPIQLPVGNIKPVVGQGETVQIPQPVPPRDYTKRAPAPLPGQEEAWIVKPVDPPVESGISEDRLNSVEIPVQEVFKSVPDPSVFSPPAARADKTTTGSYSTDGSRPSSGRGPVPSLPPRANVSTGFIPGATGNARVGRTDFSSPSPSKESVSPADETGTPSPSNSGTAEADTRKSVKYVEIDVTKFGPPPPRRVNTVAGPSQRVAVTGLSSQTLPANNPSSSVLPMLSRPSGSSNSKKVLPPKPAKLQQADSTFQEDINPSSNEVPVHDIPDPVGAVGPTIPNFAAEIANVRSRDAPVAKRTYGSTDSERLPASVMPSANMAPLDEATNKSLHSSDVTKKPVRPAKPNKLRTPANVSSLGGQPLDSNNPTNHAQKYTEAVPKPSFRKSNINHCENSFQPSTVNKGEKGTPEQPKKLKPPVKPKPLVLPFTMGSQRDETNLPGHHKSPLKGNPRYAGQNELSETHGDRTDSPIQKRESNAVFDQSHHVDKKVAQDVHQKRLENNRVVELLPQPVVGHAAEYMPKQINFPKVEVPVHSKANLKLNELSHGTNANVTTVPPPPPSRKTTNASNKPKSSTPPPPPPARNYSRATAPTNVNSSVNLPVAPAINLELASGWYSSTTSPLHLPKDLFGLNYSTTFQTTTQSSATGVVHENTRTMDLRMKDLSRLVIAIKWRNDHFQDVVSSVSKFVPSPIEYNIPTTKKLQEYSEKFGMYVTSWCLRKEGQKVGSGECWDLARDALAKGCGKHAFVSQYYHHGYPILKLTGTSSGVSITKGPYDEIRPGDILQFKLAIIYNKNSGVTQSIGSPDHTAVVYEKHGDVIKVLEQNVQGVKLVKRGEYTLVNMTKGSVIVYRPVPVEWAG